MSTDEQDSKSTVSVIVAVKNGAATLQRCIDSIVAQDWRSLETIVVDGASTDGTPGLLEKNLQQGKIARFISEPDRGIYQAWNKALRLSHGEWVCFLGSDDRFAGGRAISNLVTAARPGVRVIYGRINLVTRNGVVGATHGRPWPQAREEFLSGTNIPHPGTLHHRSLFDRHGWFDESYRIAGDYELLLRELQHGEATFVDRLVVTMSFGGISSKPALIHCMLREVRRARAVHGMRDLPTGLGASLAASWLGMWIHRALGERAYRWCADLYRMARGKPRIWTV